MKNAIYEFETQRTNITPKAFFGWCKREMKRRTGEDLSVWFDNYEDWANPFQTYHYKHKHDDPDGVWEELGKCEPFNYQIYLTNAYNVILEFDFWDEKTGFGYCYITEAER